jgi:hypothetical protein
VVTSVEDADPSAPAGEFLRGLIHYFAEPGRSRDSIKVVLVVNDRKHAGVPADVASRAGSQRGTAPLPDAVLLLSPSASSHGDRPDAFLFLCLRLAIDLFRSEQFALSFFNEMSRRNIGLKGDQAGRPYRVDTALEFGVDTTRLPATGRYAAVVIRSLRTKHAEAQRQTADLRRGEVDPFVKAVRESIFGEHDEDRKLDPDLRTRGSYAIINEVTKDFSDTLEVEGAPFKPLGVALGADGSRWRPWLGSDYPADAPALIEEAFVGFLKDLQTALQKKLAGQTSLLARHEKAGVDERIRAVAKLDALNLDLFGTGDRARVNLDASNGLVQSEIKATEDKIAAFWDEFGANGDVSPQKDLTATAIDCVRSHCPLLRIEWEDTRKLIRQYDATIATCGGLVTRPVLWLWIALCVSVFAMLPLLWFGLWLSHPGSTVIPIVSLVIWAGLFWGTFTAPYYALQRQRRAMEDALSKLEAAASEVTEKMQRRLKSIVEYVGIIQRHHFLHHLRNRLGWLAGEASRVDDYLKTVEESLGHNAAEHRVDEGDVRRVVDALHDAGECRQWLNVALTSIALLPSQKIQVTLPGSPSHIDASTCLLETSVTVKVTDIITGRDLQHNEP